MILLKESTIPFCIFDVLRKLGALDETTGFYYAAYGLQLALEQPQRLAFVTKWLYPEIGKKYQTTGSAVERGIRLLIKGILRKPRTDLCDTLFPNGEHLTAARFIAVVANYLASEEIVA